MNIKLRHRIPALLCALFLLVSLAVPTFAADTPRTTAVASRAATTKAGQGTMKKTDNPTDDSEDDDDSDSIGSLGDIFKSFVSSERRTVATLGKIENIVKISPKKYDNNMWNYMLSMTDALLPIAVTMAVILFIYGYSHRLLVDRSYGFSITFASLARLFVTTLVIAKCREISGWIINLGVSAANGIRNPTKISAAHNSARMVHLQHIADQTPALKWKNAELFILMGGAKIFMKIMLFAIVAFVVARFFKIYIYAALSPLPMACFASQSTRHYGWSYLKMLLGVALQGMIILLILDLVVHSMFNPSTGYPVFNMIKADQLGGEEELFAYVENVLICLFTSMASIFAVDRLVSRAFGLNN